VHDHELTHELAVVRLGALRYRRAEIGTHRAVHGGESGEVLVDGAQIAGGGPTGAPGRATRPDPDPAAPDCWVATGVAPSADPPAPVPAPLVSPPRQPVRASTASSAAAVSTSRRRPGRAGRPSRRSRLEHGLDGHDVGAGLLQRRAGGREGLSRAGEHGVVGVSTVRESARGTFADRPSVAVRIAVICACRSAIFAAA